MPKNLYLGVDVGGTFTKAALVDGKGKVVSRTQIPSKDFNNIKYFASKLRETSRLLVSAAGLSLKHVKAMGIGFPGPVDFKSGVIISLTNIPGWKLLPVKKILKPYLSFPVFAENDANCMALAESRVGAAKGVSCALCLTLGTGVGGGLILGGEIYRGPFFFGGEIGHMPLSVKGPACCCGGNSCLEQYVGNKAILAKAKKVFSKDICLEELSGMARKGDKRAGAIWEETAGYLAQAISGVMNLINPEVIVIGGGVARAGRVLFAPLRRYVREHAMRTLKPRVKIIEAALGNDSGFLGAAILAKEKIEGR